MQMPLHPPRATRWLLGIAGGLLVIAVAGVAALIATLEISLHPRLVASDVSISNWPGAGSAPLATAKQVAVQFDSSDVGFRSPAETASGRFSPLTVCCRERVWGRCPGPGRSGRP